MFKRQEVPAVFRFAQTAVALAEREEETVNSELVAVSLARDSMFGLEKIAAATLDLQAHRLRREAKFAGTGYKRLSLEPFKWIKRGAMTDYPVFAIYSLDNPEMIIRSADAVRENGGEWMPLPSNPQAPSPLPQKIKDAYWPYQRRRWGNWRITSTFQGVIPKTVREEIRTALPLFTTPGDSSVQTRPNIFVVGEAQWVEGVEPQRPKVRHWDPLVVGWDGEDLWLISHFDLTDVERYMIEEFPALPEHTNNMVLPSH